MNRKTVRLVREGNYAVEVTVDLIKDETGWSPYFSPDDATKLDEARSALRAGDLARATQYGRVFELMPVAV